MIKSDKVPLDKALDLMRTGSRLQLMHTQHGQEYYVIPGGHVHRRCAP